MKRAQHRVTVSLHPAAALGVVLTLLLPHSVAAQSDDAATLADFRACGALQRDSARLACFDGVLAADREGGGVDEIAEPAPVTEAVVLEDSPVAAEPAEPRVAAAPELESEPAESRAAPPTAADSADASAFMIVEMTTRIPGAARFITDDGRIFIQTSGGSNYRSFPDVPFPATLEDGALGSNFLRLGPRLRVRVRAVE